MSLKVLAICDNSPSSPTGGGVLLNTLFSTFNKNEAIFFHRTRNNFPNKRFTEIFIKHTRVRFALIDFIRDLPTLFSIYIKDIKIWSVSNIRLTLSQYFYYKLNNTEESLIKEFNPTILYVWLGSSIFCRTISRFCEKNKMPLVIHFLDNQIGLSYKDKLNTFTQKKYIELITPLITSANSICCISEEMANKYAETLNKKFFTFQASIKTNLWPRDEQYIFNSRKPIKFLYNGSIDDLHIKPLKDIANAVNLLNNEGISAKFEIMVSLNHFQRASEHFSKINNVNLVVQVDFSDLRKTLMNNDILVMAYGFDNNAIDYFKYSFPTKSVPYMLSNRVILAYGPNEIYPIKLIKNNNLGYVVNKNLELVETIKKIIYDSEKYNSYTTNSWNYANLNFDEERTSNRFKESLSSCI